ncbi:MAG: hypothetical protein ACLQDF_08400 [Desulfomonilia bacterium]
MQMMNPQMASAQGVATIAMVSLRIYRDFKEINRMLKKGSLFRPDPGSKALYDNLFAHYKALYKNNRASFNKINH